MALQLSLEDIFGVTHSECYVVIDDATLRYQQKIANFKVSFYTNKAAKDADKEPFTTKFISCSREQAEAVYDDHFSDAALKVEDTNILINGYEYLKTLAPYTDAIDV